MFLSGLGSFLFRSPEPLKKKMPKTYAVGQKIADGIFKGSVFFPEPCQPYRGGGCGRGCCDDFILDSGAFAFLSGGRKPQYGDMVDYAERYGDFVRQAGISNFVELDMYDIYGIDRTAYIDRILKRAAGGREPIPVWHKGLGVGFCKDLCKSHRFIMIGGMASGDIKPSEYGDVAKLVAYAHRQGVAVHGLGFSRLTLPKKMKFDKVDGTAWVFGRKCAYAEYWLNGKLHKFRKPKRCEYNEDATVAQNARTWPKTAQDVKRWQICIMSRNAWRLPELTDWTSTTSRSARTCMGTTGL